VTLALVKTRQMGFSGIFTTSPPCPPLLEKRRGGGMVIMGRAKGGADLTPRPLSLKKEEGEGW